MFKLKKRIKGDNGDAVIVLGLLLITSIILIGGLLLDISKAYQLKSSYVDAGKKATQSAIMNQDSQGHLLPQAAGEAIYNYESIKNETIVPKNSFFSKCSEREDDKVVYKVYFGNENKVGESKGSDSLKGQISRAAIKGKTPLDITNMLFTTDDKNSIVNTGYTSIRIDFTESTENIILPRAFALTKGSKDDTQSIKCQLLDISVRANVFVGKDGKYD